jgi:uncharacterized repeat protein (TIGR03803 family)
MKIQRLKVGGLISLLIGLVLPLNAQIFTALHVFTGSPDGSGPGALVLTNGTIYGSSVGGGDSNYGLIYSFSTNNGANYTVVHDFTNSVNGQTPNDVISDGATLYGTTKYGGTNDLGTIFRVGVNGLNFTNLWNFTNAVTPLAGSHPICGLVLSGATLYGTTSDGGSNGLGTVFKIGVNGKNYSVLHHFSTNTDDGSRPMAGLVLNGATLYGTTFNGGMSNSGTIFKITTNGTSFSLIHDFVDASDGGLPQAGLAFNNNVLFGTTLLGGDGGGLDGFGSGTVFRLGTNGADYAILHNFSGVPISTNLDGAHPVAGVLVNGNLIYGSVANGGSGGNGAIFQMTTNGGGFLLLNNFTNATAGANPRGGLALVGQTLYGTSYGNGSTDNGLAFSLILSPVITSQPSNQTTVTVGGPFGFTATADGVPPLIYQWYFNTNTAIAGATNAQLNFDNATTNQAGVYWLVVTNFYGSVTSSVATLNVVSAPTPVAPVILNFYFDTTNNGFALAVTNAVNSTNRLWATTNLVSPAAWHVIATNVMAASGLWYYTDTNSAQTNAMLFYRFSTP